MGAPMEARQNAFKKFFQRRKQKHEPLKVADSLPTTEKKKKPSAGLFQWTSRKELSESAVEPCSGSSEDNTNSNIHNNIINQASTYSPRDSEPSVQRPLFESKKEALEPGSKPQAASPALFPPLSESNTPGGLSPTRQHNLIQERDGFCRRVNKYDGSVIHVEGVAAYELGNYLGGGVAGVVYEGHRLLPEEEYPVRRSKEEPTPRVRTIMGGVQASSIMDYVAPVMCTGEAGAPTRTIRVPQNLAREGSMLTTESFAGGRSIAEAESVALEAVDDMVMIDDQDAPSRSKHMADAMAAQSKKNSDASFVENTFMEETVAIKILNPVGFRALAVDVTNEAVVAREGEPLPASVAAGQSPMEEKHVWWLVNPSSRNLRTLQRYADENSVPQGVEVDRGTAARGLRISLIAAYKDPKTKKIKELPLNRCIEVWGHVPFEASDREFRDVMSAIDKINQGQPPPALPPGRVGTATSSTDSNWLRRDSAVAAKRSGIYRAASTPRKTEYCQELKAFIALPAIPSKYIKWLRQRRAATKEIRNMMLIGRHRNVVHLFEVLECIQESKSTMFLVLELVRGGELFDLISSNTAKITSADRIPAGFTESETVMRKFFAELASGIHYCHANGIAHRDLKPENLLVHSGDGYNCVLKIADFGLSATFNRELDAGDQDTVTESDSAQHIMNKTNAINKEKEVSASPIKQQMDKLLNVGSSALGFLTCGAVEDIVVCGPGLVGIPPVLKRMTSVVGSPHYVAPEIVSQHSKSRQTIDGVESPKGYDGTKADVWSAGVILYAMLFRSLPFGEDLLRCPRYQSFKKWYDEVKASGAPKSRRRDILAPLHPVISESEAEKLLGPQWFFPSESSVESRDLIVYMLNPDPEQRPSIQHVLQHPWLLKIAT